MVRRGLVASRERARDDIERGRVTVGGAPAHKAARLVDPAEAIVLHGPRARFVSRAGEKLAAAVDRFSLASHLDGARVLDVGASTGGFTECALAHGAAEVVALDVGRNQLHERLRADPRVRNLERTNLRTLDPALVAPPADVVVGDLSFISLRLVLDPLFAAVRPGALYVLLVKPQFEAGRAEADRARGVIVDPSVWRRVLGEVGAALDERGATIMGAMVSPLTGADGNVEFLVTGRGPGEGRHEAVGGRPPLTPAATVAAFDEVVRAAGGDEA
jgi:23S rRNA (cytidine1920-2'-O)/16S rRNA (cytidine1409-2'-O)-methyltransferase